MHFSKLFPALIAGAVFLASCSNPERDFRTSLQKASSDKYIDKTELSELDAQLSKAVGKTRSGLRFGQEFIKNHEDLVQYLTDRKGCEVEGLKPSRVVNFNILYILLENSESMEGYLGNGDTGFTEPIIALQHCGAAAYKTAYVEKDAQKQKVEFRTVDSNTFSEEVAQGRIPTSGSSPLDEIIESAVNLIVPENYSSEENGALDDVFCLITDGILSGTNSEISSNREFTKQSLPVLENRIRNAVSKAYGHGLQCLVFRLESRFTGTYYDYRNGRHTLDCQRPYYFVIIGEQENLEKIEENLSHETNFTDHQSLRFASFDVSSGHTVTKANLAQMPGQALVTASGNTVRYNPAKMHGSPVEFTVKMQLKTLPKYYLDAGSMRNDFVLDYSDASSGTRVRIPNEDWLEDVSIDGETFATVITVGIDNEYLKKMHGTKNDLHLTLPGHQDDWYRSMSSSDDSEISNGDQKTFALDRFMGGIMKGFGYQDSAAIPDVVSININLLRKK